MVESADVFGVELFKVGEDALMRFGREEREDVTYLHMQLKWSGSEKLRILVGTGVRHDTGLEAPISSRSSYRRCSQQTMLNRAKLPQEPICRFAQSWEKQRSFQTLLRVSCLGQNVTCATIH